MNKLYTLIAGLLFMFKANSQVIVTEINYNSDSTISSGNWIEIQNRGNAAVDLTGWQLTDKNPSNIFNFPTGKTIQPGEFLVITNDPVKFTNRYPTVTNYIGQFNFNLGGNSDSVVLYNAMAEIAYAMGYWDSFPWPKAADGLGRTLEYRAGATDPTLPQSWFAGCIGGSPGVAYQPCNDPIVFSEINYNQLPQLNAGDWLELHNTTNAAIDISGWLLMDRYDTNRYNFPAGTIIQAGGFLIAASDTARFRAVYPNVTGVVGPIGFSFNNSSERLRLYNAQTGKIQYSVVYYDKAPWPTAADGQGYTLEQINLNGIANDGDNWASVCLGGSPGRAYDPLCGTGTNVNDFLDEFLNVHVYPNPFSNYITIDMTENKTENGYYDIQLFNYTGQLVTEKSATSKHTILPTSNLPSGLYFLRVGTPVSGVVHKLVKP